MLQTERTTPTADTRALVQDQVLEQSASRTRMVATEARVGREAAVEEAVAEVALRSKEKMVVSFPLMMKTMLMFRARTST